MDTGFNLTSYNKIEFRLISFYFIILILRLVNVINIDNYHYADIPKYHFTWRGVHYFWIWFFRYLSLYVTYIIVHFYLIKQLVQKPVKLSAVAIAVSLVVLLILVWYLCEIGLYKYLSSPDDRERDMDLLRFFSDSVNSVLWVTGIFTVYSWFKYSFLPQITRKLQSAIALAIRDTIIAIIILLVVLFFLNEFKMPDDYCIILLVLGIPAIILYAFSALYFIPLLKAKGQGFSTYWGRFAWFTPIIFVALSILFIVLNGWQRGHSGLLLLIIFLCMAFELVVVIPVCWLIYHVRTKQLTEITGLRTALGQSAASLDFLRSQINPHFLFNALNTLYGTALQENAGRTGEGIQKLGDMMRFMLQENMQEKIALLREVDYLNNYIDLQKLRTQVSPDIVIQTEIDEPLNNLQIAPMLLIPFVENAFKHGISLREPSHIKIALSARENTIYFDVHNSIHPRADNDPEKSRSGIGLENVKQRLELLYPGGHELVIRQTPKEFFVHLILNL